MSEQQHIHDDDLPVNLPGKIVELLARPSLVDVPENPVGQVLQRLESQFSDFSKIDLPEVIDLPKSRQAMGFDPVYIQSSAMHHVDADKILRYDLSLPMLLAARVNDGPLRLMSAGKVYRNDGVTKTHLEAFHQFEVLQLEDQTQVDAWSFATRILKVVETMFPERSVRITPTEYAMCTRAWELSIETDGEWTELLAWGEYIPRVVEALGGNSKRQTALGAGMGLERLACLVFQIKDIRQVELTTVGSA